MSNHGIGYGQGPPFDGLPFGIGELQPGTSADSNGDGSNKANAALPPMPKHLRLGKRDSRIIATFSPFIQISERRQVRCFLESNHF